MRLNPLELDAIRSTLATLDPGGRIYLFGSRVDDARRGGDIDLFLDATQSIDLKAALRVQYRLCSEFDQHVDLLIKDPDEPDAAIHHVARRGILL